MVTITNGVKTFDVPAGAVNGFKTAGFKLVNGKSKKKAEKEPAIDEQSEQEQQDDLLEKPLTKWTKDEIKEFAASNGIDISGTKNANEARELVKKFLDGEV